MNVMWERGRHSSFEIAVAVILLASGVQRSIDGTTTVTLDVSTTIPKELIQLYGVTIVISCTLWLGSIFFDNWPVERASLTVLIAASLVFVGAELLVTYAYDLGSELYGAIFNSTVYMLAAVGRITVLTNISARERKEAEKSG